MHVDLVTAIEISPASEWFWKAAAEGRLEVQRCEMCAHLQHPPRAVCTRCGSRSLAYEPVSGAGDVYSFTTVQRALTPALREHVPYILALIDLDVGLRVMSLVRDCDPEDVSIGMPVLAAFERVGEMLTLLVFAPAPNAPT